MQPPKPTEITGKPAQAWGNLYIPTRGKISLTINNATLKATTIGRLETRHVYIRIANLEAYELVESPLYSLLVLGIFFLLLGLPGLFANPFLGLIILLISIACMVLAFVFKNRLLIFYGLRYTLPLYLNQTSPRALDTYHQFATHLLAIAHQANIIRLPTPTAGRPPTPPAKPHRPT